MNKLPWLFQIQQSSPGTIYKAVTRIQNSMIYQQPALFRLYRHGTGSYFGALPPLSYGTHDKTVSPPVNHIGAFAVEDIPETGMPRIAGAAQHGKLAFDLAWKQNSIPVIGQKGILQQTTALEIISIAYGYGWPVISVAPCYIVAIFQPANPWIIRILKFSYFFVFRFKNYRLWFYLPGYTISASAEMQSHVALLIVTAKDTCIPIPKRNNGTVEDAVGDWYKVSGNYRITF
jgi:hypothetical protein